MLIPTASLAKCSIRAQQRGGPRRKLSPTFLETILLHDPWRSAIPRQGVRIAGAWFNDTVDFEGAGIAHELWLNRSRFTSNVDLRRVRTASLLPLNGSVINGTLASARP